LVKYLHHSKQTGVVNIMIEQLKSESMANLDLYLPQLCYLVITKLNQNMLKKFLVEISIQNANIGLRALHYF
jgi:hypothetical protein